jgi:phosphoribosylformylglycinamidine (FGAM) synthase-like amidotransferase family enzyme
MSEDGNVFGLMPHPEAASENFWAAMTGCIFSVRCSSR